MGDKLAEIEERLSVVVPVTSSQWTPVAVAGLITTLVTAGGTVASLLRDREPPDLRPYAKRTELQLTQDELDALRKTCGRALVQSGDASSQVAGLEERVSSVESGTRKANARKAAAAAESR